MKISSPQGRFCNLKLEEKKTVKLLWNFLIKIEFLYDCYYFLKTKLAKNNERDDLFPLSKTKKAAFKIFPAICDLYPDEDPQEIAKGLSQINSKEELYQFIKKNDKKMILSKRYSDDLKQKN
ncbi:MAG: hypothetical protein Q8K60_01730 [Parachlamydiaceae bacterium]|nr:hypothetical protein [Parachlamydiaceae bacterium]